jgi:hypothetical protein
MIPLAVKIPLSSIACLVVKKQGYNVMESIPRNIPTNKESPNEFTGTS